MERLLRNIFATSFVALGVAAGCGKPPDGSVEKEAPEPPLPTFTEGVRVVDEDGAPILSAEFETAGAEASDPPVRGMVDVSGRFRVEGLQGPAVAIVSAAAFVPEPVVLGGTAAGGEQSVRLWRRTGAGGARRRALHFGGDTMLGRRYLTPTSEVTARVVTGDGGESARSVVRAIAPLFRASDFRSMNLETVVGSFSFAEAYPHKRFLLLSPPETVNLLDELQVSVVTLGNNHARDWLDEGVASTLRTLDASGIVHAGAGTTEEEAAATVEVDVGGYRVGIASATSVDGDFVNDNLPDDAVPLPQPISPGEAWQYDERSFGYSGPTVTIPTAFRRIGEIWRIFKAWEPLIAGEAELDDLWLRASSTYPELQDWVARRGHGGARSLDRRKLAADIGALRASGCDLVVVQFHAGFQFFEVKSVNVEAAAHQAIDDGADLVVCHHPHVLQGFEWYHGKLIAYSLGNFVFDQDFLSTFPSVVLRVVFEEGTLLEARALPVVLERYRPSPLAGTSALGVIQSLHERSVLPLRSERIGLGVRNMLRAMPDGVVPAALTVEDTGARIVEGPAAVVAVSLDPPSEGISDLRPPALTRSRGPGGASLGSAWLGRDLFRWGSFDDDAADGEARGGLQWLLNETHRRAEVLPGAPSGVRCLRMSRNADNSTRILTRPVARIPMSRHRMYDDAGGTLTPADGPATYSLRMRARLSGVGRPIVRFDFYNFDDTNPTEDPESILIRSREAEVTVEADDAWHDFVFGVPDTFLQNAGDLEANALLLNFILSPPASGETVFRADDVQFIEWRAASSTPDGFYAIDAVRGAAPGTVVERTAP